VKLGYEYDYQWDWIIKKKSSTRVPQPSGGMESNEESKGDTIGKDSKDHTSKAINMGSGSRENDKKMRNDLPTDKPLMAKKKVDGLPDSVDKKGEVFNPRQISLIQKQIDSNAALQAKKSSKDGSAKVEEAKQVPKQVKNGGGLLNGLKEEPKKNSSATKIDLR